MGDHDFLAGDPSRLRRGRTGGSDHQALLLTLSTDAEAGITPRRRCPDQAARRPCAPEEPDRRMIDETAADPRKDPPAAGCDHPAVLLMLTRDVLAEAG